MTVNFRRMLAGVHSTKKHRKAAGYLREHVARFNGASPEVVKIDKKVNDYLMNRIVKKGSQIKVAVTKTQAGVEVKLAEEKQAVAPAAKEAVKTQAGKASDKEAPKAAAKKPAEPAANSKPKAKDGNNEAQGKDQK